MGHAPGGQRVRSEILSKRAKEHATSTRPWRIACHGTCREPVVRYWPDGIRYDSFMVECEHYETCPQRKIRYVDPEAIPIV